MPKFHLSVSGGTQENDDFEDNSMVAETLAEILIKEEKGQEDSLEATAGSWEGLVDGEELIRMLYASRKFTHL
ncbi:MAG: hypothetical protein HQK60_09045 [Deltaproteobacteria bacterium]|nr:hypothetical protein [Deltaproteobacteria bacterium]